MSDEAIENTITTADETAAEPVEDACGCKAEGKGGCRCKGHGPKRCPIKRCPIKALAVKDDESCNALGAAISVVVMATTVALSVYAQYVLTKWAVKDAVREMGHGRH